MANKITGATSRPASQFESSGLWRRALVAGSRGRYDGGAAVAQFCRQSPQARFRRQVSKQWGVPKGNRGIGDGGMHRFNPETGHVYKGGFGWEDTGPAS
jgi:hypothetical protein